MVLKVTPTISFPCDVIAMLWTSLFLYNYNNYYNCIGIIIALNVNSLEGLIYFYFLKT